MCLQICEAEEPRTIVLGPNLGAGEQLSAVVPAGWWQASAPLPHPGTAGWSLVCCTVSPAFLFEGFEMAPPGWQPATVSAAAAMPIRWRAGSKSRILRGHAIVRRGR